MRHLLLPLAALLATPAAAEIPRLEKRGEATQLVVDGQPFLILGGELGNSSASHREYLAPYWARLKAMNLNTVIAPVSWELVEPEEGKFDWASLEWLVEDARKHDMKLVILWFGVWKNSMSTYVPGWVKRDARRFPRTQGPDGRSQEILSAYAPATRDADARAFAALMARIKAIDADRNTVLMVQVENEVGFLPVAKEGTLSSDPRADERVMATAYARFINKVAAAGKKAYPLPLYANGAQGRPGKLPGEYPSAGPLAHLADIWTSEAPALDFLAPDIYFPNFGAIAKGYVDAGQPLFIPEANYVGEKRIGANSLHAIGRLKAFGYSPFAIESADEATVKRIGSLYGMLGSIASLITEAQARGRITGFANPVSFEGKVDDSPMVAELGNVRWTATTIVPFTSAEQTPAEHGALLIWLGGEDFLMAGKGVTFTAEPLAGKGRIGFEVVEEGRYVDGVWRATRRLNGDQTHQGRHVRIPPDDFGLQKVRIYRYP